MNINALIKAVRRSDLIITPVLEPWLLKEGDNALPLWVLRMLFDVLATPPRNRSKSFSGSAAGSCPRAQELQFANVPQDPTDAQLQNIFNDGKYRHLRWQGMLLAAGLLTDIEYLVQWPDMLSRGSLDGRGVIPPNHHNVGWRGLEYGFELKGVSTFQYTRLVKDGPMEKHLRQIAMYFVLTNCDLFSLVYEDKTTQSWHEWVYKRSDLQAFINDGEKEIWELKNAVESKKLHPILPECKLKKGAYQQCGYGTNGRCSAAANHPPAPFVL